MCNAALLYATSPKIQRSKDSPPQKWIRQNPPWFWNPKEMSPEIQNRGTIGPKIGNMYVPGKTFLKKIKEKMI